MSNVGRSWVLAAVVCTAAFVTACAPPPAPAPDPLIDCSQVAAGITYSPPATNSGADITIATTPGAAISGCVDHTGAGITGGELTLTSVLPGFLCTDQLTGQTVGSGTGDIRWSDGSVSTVDADVRIGAYAFVVEFTVTAGRWNHARASVQMIVTSGDGSCTPASPTSNAYLMSDGPIAFHPPIAPTLPPRTDLAQVVSGGNTSCALMENGTVTCWGDNSDGQLGNVLFAPGGRSTLPVPVTGLTGATQVDIGVDHACALLGSGGVRCWGNNSNGQLGNGTTNDATVPVAVLGLGGGTPVSQISVGYRRTCALLADGTVRCWGMATGAGGTDSSTTVAVGGLTGVTQVAAGSDHTCALGSDGSVQCWGSNQFGQLGNGTQTDSLVPVPVYGLSGALQVTAGSEHTCALTAGHHVVCWGFNRYGQLGTGGTSETPQTFPALVMGPVVATSIDAGGATTCAVVTEGSVSCWGSNEQGSLGNGVTTMASARPSLVLGITGAQFASAGGHSCATLPGGRAECWGSNWSGELGDATLHARSVPAPVLDP